MRHAMLLSAARPVWAAMVVLLLLAELAGLPYARTGATLAAVLATALLLPTLTRMAQVFCAIGLLAFAFASRLPPERFAEVQLALWQGVAFCALLCVLGLLRAPVGRSPLVGAAASYLASFPTAHRYGAINIGSHFLSLLFNVGVVPLIGTLLKASELAGRAGERGYRHMLMAGLRGTTLMTVWSPMGLGFAITTTAIVGLDPAVYLAVAFASAMVLLGLTCLVLRGDAGAAAASVPLDAPRGSPRALIVILGASAGLLAATVAVHHLLGVGFILATVVVLPLFALGWSVLEAGAPAAGIGARIGGLLAGLTDLRTEAAVFLSANVIGATITALVRAQPAWDLMKGGHYPTLPILIACLALVPLAGAAFIPHSILVVLIAQLLGSSPLGVAHPTALALTLSLGWALGISVSPISALSLMTGALAGVPSHVVALSWNLRFAFILFAASAAIVCLAVALGA